VPRRRDPLESCLAKAVKAGKITRSEAERVRRMFEGQRQQYRGSMGDAAAEAAARRRTAERLEAEARQQKIQKVLQILAQKRALDAARTHPRGILAGAFALLDRDPWEIGGLTNVWARSEAILGTAHAMFADAVAALRPKLLGLQHETVELRKFVQELFGRNTGDPLVQEYARAWHEVTEWMAKRWKAAGGTLFERKDWRLPNPHHNAQLFTSGNRATWKAFMREQIAAGGLMIRDFDTGLPASPEKIEEILDRAFESIRTGGLSDLQPGTVRGKGKRANARTDPRVFEWQSPDAWLAYNEQWGEGTAGIFKALMGHLERFARDIAMLEVLGPNPQHTVRLLADTGLQDAVRRATGGPAMERIRIFKAKRVADALENLYLAVSGELNVPVDEFWARIGGGLRAWLSAAQLGSATLSSTTDFVATAFTARWNGIPAGRILARYVKLLDPRNAEHRKIALRMGLVADAWARAATGRIRHQFDIVGRGLPEKVADTVIRASGLSAHTQALQHAFGMEFMASIAELRQRPFARLPAATRRAFQRGGLTPELWNRLRAGPVLEAEGVHFFDIVAFVRSGDRDALEAAHRLQQIIAAETRFAVPTPGPLERSMMTMGTRPGKFLGEVTRAFGQYKSFGLTILMTHAMRGMAALATRDARGLYLVAFATAMTFSGALSSQMKQIAAGRDPRPMNTKEFWLAAFLQGGGAGILGDFLYAATDRAGHGISTTATGPSTGFLEDLGGLTIGNVAEALGGKDPRLGRDLVRFARRYTPGTTLWYARLALDRMLWDRLEELADPDAAGTWKRRERRYRRDFGQRFWWRAGDATPRRPPDLRNAIGIAP